MTSVISAGVGNNNILRLAQLDNDAQVVDSMVNAVWVYDIDKHRIVWANKAALELWESDSFAELSSRDFSLEASEAVQQILLDYKAEFAQGRRLSRSWRFSPKGIFKEAFCHLSGVRLQDGRIAMLVEANTEISKQSYDDSALVTLSTYNMDGSFVSGNPPFLDTVCPGYNNLSQLFSSREMYQKVRTQVATEGKFEGDVLIQSMGKSLWHKLVVTLCEHESLTKGLLVQQFNIDSRKRKELQLELDATTDPLTGLLNRRGLKSVAADKHRFIVFYIDLDGFKLVNDSLGHNTGDRLLCHLAKQLSQGLFEQGYACRCGGDEFIWLIEEHKLYTCVENIAQLLIKTMSQPVTLTDNKTISVSASIGLAHYPDDASSFEQVVVQADAAMYLAKEQGKHRWVQYTQGMEKTLQRHSQVAQYLHQALANKELSLHYQPIFDLASKQIHSFEALLRWYSPELGPVPANECIEVAEEIGIIKDIEKWVIATAIRDVKVLRQHLASDVAVAINISGKCFADPALLNFVEAALAFNQLPSQALHLELTETALLLDANTGCKTASKIQQQGVSISIDDFGTGYSSLSYLDKIPANIVKIDRSFTNAITQNDAMMRAIAQLLQSLNFDIVVEGVETQEQSELLQQIGLTLQQGFGLGRPQPLSYYTEQTNIANLSN